MGNTTPFITVMIVVRNEEKYIEKCFLSLLNQTYPSSRYEILIIDGKSTDATLSIAKETYLQFQTQHEVYPNVRYFTNEKETLAAGWNLGIQASLGEYVARIDAHGYADSDYIEKSVETTLRVPDAVCVGGSMRTSSLTARGNLIASVLSSPFGIGNSRFRYSQKEGYVDTVAFGLYRKSIFKEVGYFDESMRRNQDNDLHRRIRAAGGKFYLNPAIRTTYYCRDTIRGMLKQGYQNGKWNIISFRKGKSSLSLRHLVPLFFVCTILLGIILGHIHPLFFCLLGALLLFHLALGTIFSLKATHTLGNFLLFPWLCMALHLCYGMGSLLEFFHFKNQ